MTSTFALLGREVNFLMQVFCIVSVVVSSAQPIHFKHTETNINSSLRGLSVVDNKVAWVSGSDGWVGRTNNGGKSWKFSQVQEFEDKGFRSLYAFDDKRALIANAGAPAHILISINGGNNWKKVYTNMDSAAFFDGMDFWNSNEGLIYGDAINGKMLLLRTKDGGNTWTELISAPELEEGEASFAASGTGIRCFEDSKVIIATGGKKSRLWMSEDKGETWRSINPPVVQGKATTGIYSLAVSAQTLNLVGGDYKNPPHDIDHNLVSNDYAENWKTPTTTTRGYRECVEFISNNTWIATGPTGTDITEDGGMNWKPLSDEEGYHVVRKARNGTLLIIAGAKGQISLLKWRK
ncbi:MAG TPA: photosystem II stability/assembly factor-like protein [Cyclobacteriaceae bacterium]